ncbi:aldo/keto reductase [Alkalihalobacillus sp. AL-G]|uniref:aldo/keto reductase n=1 Tax=Alkalihalobacillus sp. AL-G TaxID=2926399 RepID=UPI00272976F3|nr:aldo/keto reductase [Alkalihalobacillus sp. AL-G]WLD91567.1 aldo/keto reductase [Alkalihalobacillus sp. AL-G]
MVTPIKGTTTLHNGLKMPWLGFGVFKVEEGNEVIQSVKWALEAGYRSIDTAAIYRNEEGVGRAIRESGISREDLFITTKVWNKAQGFESTLGAFEKSMNKLGLDYLDLYLIHWPVEGKFKETWKAMEKLYKEGRVKAIGVSNFQVHHLKDLIEDAEIKPMVNQVEFHPHLTQQELRTFCREQNIQMEAWSPLMHGKLLDHPALKEISNKYGKSPAQVILRWDLQHGIVTIPKSVNEHRIHENANLFDFKLTEEEMSRIDGLNRNERFGPDPDNFDF